MSDERTYEGKKLVPALVIGCLLFAVLMFGGTFLLAKITAPYFRKRGAYYQKQAEEKHLDQPAPTANP